MTLKGRREQHGRTCLFSLRLAACPILLLLLFGMTGLLKHAEASLSPSRSSSAASMIASSRTLGDFCTCRGGDLTRDEEENRKLDEYIEQLVASVDTSDVNDDDTAGATKTIEAEQNEEEEIAYEEEEDDEIMNEMDEETRDDMATGEEEKDMQRDVEVDGSDDEEVEDASQVEEQLELVDDADEQDKIEEEQDETILDKEMEHHGEKDVLQHDDTAKSDTDATKESTKQAKRKGKRRKMRPDDRKAEPAVEGDKTSIAQEKETPSAPAVTPYRRPNALYRFLLGQGRIGHVVVMACVMVVEWIQTYVPTVVNFLSWVMLNLGFGGGSASAVEHRDYDEALGMQSKVNAQYAAFVSTDGSTVRGKQQKKQAKQADQKAFDQLRRVGSVKDAKYRHVSLAFMKRHGIGPFHDDAGQKMVKSPSSALSQKVEEEDSDVDWVVKALSAEEKQTEKSSLFGEESAVKPSISVGVGSGGPRLSVGVEIELGGSSKKKKKRRKSVIEAATEKEPARRKVSAGPRASDRDGGGGIVGRLRSAVGSNIPSSLLGAYPGDAVPASEAASADGVVALARKYGYGDWSDDDTDGNSRAVTRRKKKVRKTRSGGSTKRREQKRSTSSGSSSLSLGFDVSMGGRNGLSRTSSGRRRSSRESIGGSSRLTTRTRKTSPRSTSKSEMLVRAQDNEQRNRLATSEKLVRLPTERTKEIQSRLAEKKESTT